MTLLKFLFFNQFSKFILTAKLNDKANKADNRLTCYILELVFPMIALMPMILTLSFFIPVTYKLFTGQNVGDYYEVTATTLINLFLLTVALNKDFFSGQSIVHRTYGYKVLDNKLNVTASELKCLTRNLTAVLFPIEFVFVLINRQRRLGDLISGTKLVQVEKTDPESILIEIENTDFGQKSKLVFTIPIILIGLWTVWGWTMKFR